MKQVRPEGQFDPITFSDRDYGLWALHSLEDAEKLARSFDYHADQEKLDPEGQAKWERDRLDLERHVITVILFSALAVEAFLNTYGVVRMGAAYYNSNVEKLRPTEKVSAIVLALTLGSLLEKGDRIIQVTHEVFAARNEIAHPKAEELKWNTSIKEHLEDSRVPDYGGVGNAKNSVKWMVTFFREFEKLVPESAVWINPHVLKGKLK